jgi:imidazolonepropionase-like amidohydrolase
MTTQHVARTRFRTRLALVRLGSVGLLLAMSGSVFSAHGQEPSPLERVEALGLDTAHVGRVTAYFAPADRDRAVELAALAEGAAAFFERELGISFSFGVAALAPEHWFSEFPGVPYAIPWVSVTERLLFVASSLSEGFMVRGPTPLHDRRRIDKGLLHEYGHLLEHVYLRPGNEPNAPRVPWFWELLANVFAYAYISSSDPAWAAEGKAMWRDVVEGYTPAVVSLDWGFMNDLPPNELARTYAWYQNLLNLRAAALHEAHGLDFIRLLKERLAWAEAADWTTASLLESLEEIAPGFKGWADDLRNPAYLPLEGGARLETHPLEPGTLVYDVIFADGAVGRYVHTLARDSADGREVFVVRRSYVADNETVRQQAVFDARTFEPVRSWSNGGIIVDFTLRDGRVTGTTRRPGGEPRTIDLRVPPGTLLPWMFEAAVMALPFRPGYEADLGIVTYDGALDTLTLRVTGATTLAVPAGEIDVYEIEVSGASSLTLWVRRQSPHVVVREDLPGLGLSMRLAEVVPSSGSDAGASGERGVPVAGHDPFRVPASAAAVPSRLAPVAACAPTPSAQPTTGLGADLAIMQVHVIDVADGSVRSNQTVLISGNRITALGPSQHMRPPEGAEVIDARGRYLIPGLWDMHAHAASEGRVESFFRLFLANGITGFRDPFGSREVAARARAAVAAGELPGPARIMVAGNLVDGPPGSVPGARIAATPEDGRHMVDSLHAADAPFIKVYFQLAPETYFAIAERSAELGVPFVGHVPMFVRAADASDTGQRSIEHLTGVLTGCSADEEAVLVDWQRLMGLLTDGDVASFTQQYMEPVTRALATQDEARCRRLAERFVANRTWQAPTLVSLRGKAYLREMAAADDPRTRYFTPPSRWTGGTPFGFPMTEAQWEVFQAQYEREKEIVGMMAAAGVGFLAGSDTPTPWAFPGFGLHDELELLVEAGLTPLQALQAATLYPARFFGLTDDLGTIAEGGMADVVLLDANPLEDIRNTRRIHAVVVDGRLLDRVAIDRMLADVERARLQ